MTAIAAWWKRHPIVRATLDNGRRVRGRFQYDWVTASSGEHLVVVQLGLVGSWRCYRKVDFSEKVFPWGSVEPVFARTIPSEVQP